MRGITQPTRPTTIVRECYDIRSFDNPDPFIAIVEDMGPRKPKPRPGY